MSFLNIAAASIGASNTAAASRRSSRRNSSSSNGMTHCSTGHEACPGEGSDEHTVNTRAEHFWNDRRKKKQETLSSGKAWVNAYTAKELSEGHTIRNIHSGKWKP